VVIFLSLSFNFFAVGDEDENIEKIFNQFIERAKLFGNIFEKGDPNDLAKMFKPYQHAPIIVINVIKDNPVSPVNDIQDYYFYISNVNANLKFSWADDATIRYFRNVKESDNSEHTTAYLTDYGRTIGNIQSRVCFNKGKTPTECSILYNVFLNQGEKQISSRTNWDEKGNIVMKKEWNLVTEKKITTPPIPHSVQERLAKKEISNQTKTFFSFNPVTFPKVNNKKIEAIFKRIEYLANMKRPRDLAQLFDWELTKKESSGAIQCVDGKVRDIHFMTSVTGYNLSIGENGMILAYAEGKVQYGEKREFENFYKNQGKSRQYYWHMLNNFYVLEKGIEVTFHSNGYPANYRTVVNNRLYGRQIEWNDKGELISDVDLDIPKEWKDAPKRNESQPK
jgi:hypothetical protein